MNRLRLSKTIRKGIKNGLECTFDIVLWITGCKNKNNSYKEG